MAADFRVEQTYDEIRQAVHNAAISVLTHTAPMDPEPSDWELRLAESQANRIADQAVSVLDAAE